MNYELKGAVNEFYGGEVSEADFFHRMDEVRRMVK